MPIVPQLLLTLLTIYWSWLTDRLSDIYYARLVERCPHHPLVQWAEELDLTPIETGCAAYQHGGGPGAPSTYPIAVLARCLLVKYLFNLSLREMEQRLYSDLLVRWFVGLVLFGETPDHSTLERFEQWVIAHQPRLYFDTVLQQIDRRFPHSRALSQIGDTYAMEAKAAEEELLPRLAIPPRSCWRRQSRACPHCSPLPFPALPGTPCLVHSRSARWAC